MTELLIFLLILFLFPLAIWYEIKLDKKDTDKREQADIEWLNNEKLKPRYRIQIVVSEGNNYGPVWTSPFEPTNSVAGSPWNMRYTSKNLAEIHLIDSYQSGYFTDETGVAYPTCQVIQALVEEVENEKK